ncbi:hypothetical protein BDY19DRAFT_988026, partial [Irpex rosettiformis]
HSRTLRAVLKSLSTPTMLRTNPRVAKEIHLQRRLSKSFDNAVQARRDLGEPRLFTEKELDTVVSYVSRRLHFNPYGTPSTFNYEEHSTRTAAVNSHYRTEREKTLLERIEHLSLRDRISAPAASTSTSATPIVEKHSTIIDFKKLGKKDLVGIFKPKLEAMIKRLNIVIELLDNPLYIVIAPTRKFDTNVEQDCAQQPCPERYKNLSEILGNNEERCELHQFILLPLPTDDKEQSLIEVEPEAFHTPPNEETPLKSVPPPAPIMAQPLHPDIVAAIGAAVAAAMQNMPVPQVIIQPASAPAVTLNTTDIVKPDKYKGEKGRDLERFLSQYEAYWVTASITDERQKDVDDWAKLKAKLVKFFGDATPEDTAFIELDKLCNLEKKERDKRDVATYITDSQSYVARIQGLSEKDKEIRFTCGLPDFIYCQLATSEVPPADYDTWEAAEKKPAATYAHMAAKPPAPQQPRVHSPPRQSNTGPVPMDVDASRTETRTCYNCNKVGHLSRFCTEPRQPRQVQATTTNAEALSSNAEPTATPRPNTYTDATIAAVLQQMEELRQENAELKKHIEEGF